MDIALIFALLAVTMSIATYFVTQSNIESRASEQYVSGVERDLNKRISELESAYSNCVADRIRLKEQVRALEAKLAEHE